MNSRSHWPVTLLSGASAMINMLLPLVLVRLLRVDEVGDYKIFFLYLMILPDLCFSSGLMNGLSYWAGRKETGLAAIRATHLLALGVAISVVLFCLLFDGVIQSVLPQIHYPSLFALAAGGALLARFYEETNIALGYTWKGALFHSVGEAIRAFSILIVALISHSFLAVLVTHTVVSLSKSCIGYVLLYAQGLLSLPLEREVWNQVLRYSFPVALAGVFSFLVAHIDQLLLSYALTPEDFAIYAIGCLVVPPLLILEHSVTRVCIPVLSSALEEDDKREAQVLYRNAIEQIAFLVIPAVCGLVLFAEPIITLLFTDRYVAAVPYLKIFAFSYLALLVPYDAVARAEGDSKWILSTFVRFGVLALFLGLTLVGLFGPMGALSALLLSQFGLRVYGLQYAAKRLGCTLWKLLPSRPILRMLGVSLVLSL
ncbi:MAG: oligosaccharide flippase family protein, partial [Bdellovibrionales bacterium]|nr:oligosaccharide flippase family protein [Bdellovibrionales bacterium]